MIVVMIMIMIVMVMMMMMMMMMTMVMVMVMMLMLMMIMVMMMIPNRLRVSCLECNDSNIITIITVTNFSISPVRATCSSSLRDRNFDSFI